MRYLKIIFLFAVILWGEEIFSQNNSLSYPDKNGIWQFTAYNENIIKTTYRPHGYINNERISNAVILKPSKDKIKYPNIEVFDNKDGKIRYIYSGKKLLLRNYFESGKIRGFKFQLNATEKIYGTGERSVPLNRRGYKLNLYNNPNYGYGLNAQNLNYSVPFIISSEGYGIFFDNPSRGYIDIGKSDPGVLEYGASSGELTFYIINGKNVDEIIRHYQSLVGTQPIPARWVFGNLMSRFGYRTEEQLTSTVEKMKRENFPLDAVILDLFWFGDSIKGTMGNLEWVNKKAWPNPARMIKNLKTQGINTILITEPFVLNTTSNYNSSKKFHAVDSARKPFVLTDFYFGNGGLLDLFRNDAQQWFWSKYKPQITKGVAGWWGDLGEPEKHPSNVYHNLKDLGFKRLFKADEVHNIYGHYWDKMLFDRYAKEYPGVRLFNLNRSGYAGSARYGVFPWSGDVSRSWDGLKAQLPLMIGMSMSGVPYIHADAGGFAGGDGDAELYTRWLQFAVFTPIFRPHGTALGNLAPDVKDIPSEPAFYDDPYKSIVRNYIQLRYQLLPYNYTLAYQQAKFGKPLVRPLFYYDNADSNLYKTDNQFMWGDNILIAPVLEKSVTEQKVYLPAGNWYNFISDEKRDGNKWITEKIDLNNIPVFVKQGSFIPMFVSSSRINNTGYYKGNDLTVKYYPSSNTTTYIFYDDDGYTNNTLAKGNYELIKFEGRTEEKKVILKITPANKKIIMNRKMKLVLPAAYEVISFSINGRVVKNGSFTYSGKPLQIVLRLK